MNMNSIIHYVTIQCDLYYFTYYNFNITYIVSMQNLQMFYRLVSHIYPTTHRTPVHQPQRMCYFTSIYPGEIAIC